MKKYQSKIVQVLRRLAEGCLVRFRIRLKINYTQILIFSRFWKRQALKRIESLENICSLIRMAKIRTRMYYWSREEKPITKILKSFKISLMRLGIKSLKTSENWPEWKKLVKFLKFLRCSMLNLKNGGNLILVRSCIWNQVRFLLSLLNINIVQNY